MSNKTTIREFSNNQAEIEKSGQRGFLPTFQGEKPISNILRFDGANDWQVVTDANTASEGYWHVFPSDAVIIK